MIPTADEIRTFQGGVGTSGPDGIGRRFPCSRARRSRLYLNSSEAKN